MASIGAGREGRLGARLEALVWANAGSTDLENLLSNAWKYSAKVPEAMIEVGSLEREGRRAFYVRDNGAGFDMSEAHKLF